MALADTVRDQGWETRAKLFPDLKAEELLFMDDGVLWGMSCESVGTRLSEFANTLRSYGLTLNLGKCRLYCSPWYKGRHTMVVQEVQLQAESQLEVMGIKFRAGASVMELIQPLLSRVLEHQTSLAMQKLCGLANQIDEQNRNQLGNVVHSRVPAGPQWP